MADELPLPDLDLDPDAPADADAGVRDDIGVVTRSVEVAADPAEVWRAVADPAERALWLDDPDALARAVRVDESAPGERLVWTWWHPEDGGASTVSVVLTPAGGGGTRVVVTESLHVAPVGGARGTASASARSAGRRTRRPASWVRCGLDRWDGRLLGLELLFVAARAGVA